MYKIFVLCLFVLVLGGVKGLAKHYCADMRPQNSVDIDQLMGMWFGIEILSHKPNEEGIVEYYDSCPVIYLSEVEQPTTVAAYGYGADYGYGSDYGRTYSTGHHLRISTTTPRPATLYDQHLQFPVYGMGNAAQNTPYATRHNKREELRRLRLLWDESGINIEYALKFNATRAGFWMSSGPQNGSMLEKQYSQFAGTIQVMKAVGNHMVLTFCHQVPDRQLFSILLSREPRLTYQEIQGVHNLLSRRDLTIGNVRKVCNSSWIVRGNSMLFVVALVFCLWFKNWRK